MPYEIKIVKVKADKNNLFRKQRTSRTNNLYTSQITPRKEIDIFQADTDSISSPITPCSHEKSLTISRRYNRKAPIKNTSYF